MIYTTDDELLDTPISELDMDQKNRLRKILKERGMPRLLIKSLLD